MEKIEGAQTKLYLRNHIGHEPRSDVDYFFLPIRLQAIYYCEESLTTLKDVQAALLTLRRRARFLSEVAPSHEQVSFRFRLTSKDVGNIASNLQVQNVISQNDWTNVYAHIPDWKEKKKIIFFQRYDPCNVDPYKRPFVLIMMDNWMLQIAKRLTPNSAWAVDSTFKTNQYNMPLFEVVCPNEEGIGMPMFLMLCSNDKNSGHEGIALQLTMKKYLKFWETFVPTRLLLTFESTKKYSRIMLFIEYYSYRVVIQMDPHCWENCVVGGTQTKCHLLLYNFHTKKAWVENL